MRVELVPYDPDWPARFAAHAARIEAALGERAVSVEHVGSTSVPGLAAKPTIDVLLVVPDPTDEAAYVPALEAAGYVLRFREPDFEEHRFLQPEAGGVNVHVFGPDAEDVRRMLLFRERLRSHADEREVYEATKRRLAARDWETIQHYADAKSDVVLAIVARARAARSTERDATSP